VNPVLRVEDGVARSDQPDGGHRTARHRATHAPATVRHPQMRAVNAWSVLHALRRLGTASRSQLAEATGLTPMTVHRLMDGLQQRGLVVSAGTAADGTIGRPSSLFQLNGASGAVLGIDVGNETVRIRLTDLGMTRVRRTEVLTASVEANLAGGLLGLVRELADAGEPTGPLVGAAIGIPAVPSKHGRVIRASLHHAWEGLELGPILEDALGCPVVVSQDDHLAAFAELTTGACRGTRSAVVLNIGKGIGVGLVSDGVVHTGGHHAAGRIATIPIPGLAESSGVAPSRLGELLTADGLIREYRDAGGAGPVASARDVFAADAAGDAAATGCVTRFADRLGWLMAALITIIDPEILVFGGGISGAWPRLEPLVAPRVDQILPSRPPIVASSLGSDAVVLGAIEAAMNLGDEWLRVQVEAPASGSGVASPH
jgi:predicted NBD/HSP70 family sugar kinase